MVILMTKNKQDLVNEVSEMVGITKTLSNDVIDAIMEVIKSNLSKGNEVNLNSFLNFQIKQAESRMGRNPSTNTPMEIPAHNKLNIKVSSVLKDIVKSVPL